MTLCCGLQRKFALNNITLESEAGHTLPIAFRISEGDSSSAIAALSAIFLALTKLLCAILRALDRVVLSLVVDRLMRDSVICIALIMCVLAGVNRDSHAVIQWIIFFACFIGFSAAGFFVQRNRPKVSSKTDDYFGSRREWILTSSSLWLANLFEICFSRVEVIFLAYYSTHVNAGKMAVLFTLSTLVLLPLLALNVVFQPKIASIDGFKNGAELRAVISRFTRFSLPPTFLIGLIILIIPSYLLRLFGSTDLDSTVIYCLYALTASRLLVAPLGPSGSVLLMKEGHAMVALVYGLAMPLKLFLLFTFVSGTSNTIEVVTAISIFSIVIVQLTLYYLFTRQMNKYVND